MEICKLLLKTFFTLQILLQVAETTDSNLFGVYIGAGYKDVRFSDVPILPDVEFHFMLAFAVDFDDSTDPPSPTNDGVFNVFWDKDNLSPEEVTSIKDNNENVKVVLSIGGFTCGGNAVKFDPISVDSWVSNAVTSLTEIIEEYNLDGIDIDYEQFIADSDTFSECIGQLVSQLKESETISIASIAPYGNDDVQNHYQTLWRSYADVFDYVNFQFYAYEKGTSMSLFLEYYDLQISNYEGGNILAGFSTEVGAGGVSMNDFFDACEELMSDGKLTGIFVWSADDSKDAGFSFETQSQNMLAATAQDDDTATESNVFRVYIGAGFKDVQFSDVPILPDVEFHFILAFAVDFTDSTDPPSPTNDGMFNVFWDKDNLSPEEVTAIKDNNENVKVVLSIGGFTCGGNAVKFDAISVDSWVSNAVTSLTEIITEYNLDGIDIDYEQFTADSDIFSECMGQLVTQLKESETISIASIAPYGNDDVQSHYQTLWGSYGYLFDYVNFQFYAYEKDTSMSLFLEYFDEQISNYEEGNILAGFSTEVGAGGVSMNDFFDACEVLMSDGKLSGIFVWSADDSKDAAFSFETQSQNMLAAPC